MPPQTPKRRANDPLGMGRKSYPEVLQRLYLVWQGNPYFDAEAVRAREILGIPSTGFRDYTPYIDWFVTRFDRHGHDDRFAGGRIYLRINGQRFTDGETLMRALATGEVRSIEGLRAPPPCCARDPLYVTAEGLAHSYGIDAAQAEPGFEHVIADIARFLLFNRWTPRRARIGSNIVYEKAVQRIGENHAVVHHRSRPQDVGAQSRGGEGGKLATWYQWWKQKRDGVAFKEIHAPKHPNDDGEVYDERMVREGIAAVEELMQPMEKPSGI